MPCKSEGLVLTVDPNVIHKVDTHNAQNLFSMWTVFSRCADSVEQGRRLENLSWRLWNRETFCCDVAPTAPAPRATSLPKDIPERRIVEDLPQLSGSVDSVVDEEAIDLNTESDPVDIVRPRIVRQDSYASSRSRGRERHITSDHLEKMVVSIIKEKEPNLSPLPQINPSEDLPSPSPSVSLQSATDESQPSSTENIQTTATPPTETLSGSFSAPLEKPKSQGSATSGSPATTVVRGFSPSQIPSVRISHEPRFTAPDAIPEPKSSPAAKSVQPKKPPKFMLGSSSGDESSAQSLETRQPVPQPKRKMFQLGGSSEEDKSPSLKSAMHTSRPSSLLSAQKKHCSISNQVTTQTIQTPSDQSDSYVDESAIDDDDEDSEWEDSIEESGKSSMDDTVTFKRVPSKPNLTSQRSLISLMFAGQDNRARALGNHASQSTSAIPHRARTMHNMSKVAASPNDSDDQGLEMRRGLRPTPLKPINEIPRSGAQPIMTNAQTHRQQAALSPRTTRRNMLATELTESLRRHLLWERQQKTSTANAVLKRRHTSHDVANLKQYPEKVYMNKPKEDANTSSWNQYFNRDAFGGYHAQGW
ncbi:hypothetical protein DL769_006616 [Monosporascus sp. CRB-8-3]|nr:hypothetical protein DL769_006616 [Monosporascus sp. CRB-8-3]